MKTFIALLLLGFNAQASNEIALQYMKINQSLFNTIKFEADAIGVEYSYIHTSGFGLKLGLATGAETEDKYNSGYTNKIKYMYSVSAMYRFNITDNLSVEAVVGINDYKTIWKLNDIEPDWSGTSDSGWAYAMNVNYKVADYKLTFGYADLYRKHKKGFGDEPTKAFKFGITYVI